MVTEGATVFEALDRERSHARQEVERDRAEAAQVEAQVRELVASRGATLQALAKHYLPDLGASPIERSFEGIRAELQAIAAKKEGHRRELQERLAAARGETANEESALAERTQRLNALVARRGELESQVAAALGADPEFARLSREAAEAELMLHRNEQRVEEIRAEAAAKRPAFERSRLFRYLYERGYGTPSYQAQGTIGRLDAWVARLIDFPQARTGYEFLVRTPALVESEVARRREAFDALMGQVEALQERESESAGLTAVLREGQSLGAERDQAVAALARSRQQIAAIETELSGLDSERDVFYQEALQRLSGFLDRTEAGVIQRQAARSPEPEDDAMARQAADLGRSIAQLTDRLTDLGRRRQRSETSLASLERLTTRFRQENYDSDRSSFENLPDLAGLLAAVRRGDMTAESLWDTLGKSQRFRPLRGEPASPPGQPWSGPGTTAGPVAPPDVVVSPVGRVLIGAMGQALGAAMQEAAWRGVQRRDEAGSPPPTWSQPPTPAAPTPAPAPPPPPITGGFTSGAGF